MTPLLAPALAAGAIAIGATAAIERWGGRIGGLLGTIPTTIIPATIGILANSPDPAAFRDAMAATPAGMLVNALFLALWRVLPPRLPAGRPGARLALMLGISLLSWGLLAAGAVLALDALRRGGVSLIRLGIALDLALVGLGVLACRGAPPAPRGARRAGPLALLSRGALAAAAIAIAIALAAASGPLVAGMAAVFPAIFLTTMVSLWLAQGEAVQGGAVGPMILGSASVSTYALLAAFALPALGAAAGSLLAWILAVAAVTVPAWRWLQQPAQ